jgi:hypothetical protein
LFFSEIVPGLPPMKKKVGAFGEFSESINVLIQGLAHEGALKNPENSARATTRQLKDKSTGG